MPGKKPRRDRRQERVAERAESERVTNDPGIQSNDTHPGKKRPTAIGADALLEMQDLGMKTARALDKAHRSYVSALKRNCNKDDIRSLEKIATTAQKHAAAMKQAIGCVVSVSRLYLDHSLDQLDSEIHISIDNWRAHMEKSLEDAKRDAETPLH
jgi:hypothetical protein